MIEDHIYKSKNRTNIEGFVFGLCILSVKGFFTNCILFRNRKIGQFKTWSCRGYITYYLKTPCKAVFDIGKPFQTGDTRTIGDNAVNAVYPV
jgi:hypothetical protein